MTVFRTAPHPALDVLTRARKRSVSIFLNSHIGCVGIRLLCPVPTTARKGATGILVRFYMAHLAFLVEQIAQLGQQIVNHIKQAGLQRTPALLQTIQESKHR